MLSFADNGCDVHQVGRLVQALKDANLYDDTIISFVGDHGYQVLSAGLRLSNWHM
jgi:arylsulfatase A-like enzyme